MDHLYLYKMVEQKRYEDENFSFPFLVDVGGGNLRYAWFSFDLTGNAQTGAFVHISRILILQKNEELRIFRTAFDVPCINIVSQQGNYMDYLQSLVKLEENFSEESMNHKLQDFGMKPLFNAFQCVRNYIRTHYKED